MEGTKLLPRLLGEEEAGHLGHHIYLFAAHRVANGKVQEYYVTRCDLSAIGSHQSFGCLR